METHIITFSILFGIMTVVVIIIQVLKAWAKRDWNYTQLAPETGKVVVKGENVVKILFNSEDGHYDEHGDWKPGEKQKLGRLFNFLGITDIGLSPIFSIMHFKRSWCEFVENRTPEAKSFIKLEEKEDCTSFSRFYAHAVEITDVEMKAMKSKPAKKTATRSKKGASKNVDGKDEGTIKINAVLIVTFQVMNIIKVIFKVPPQGIIFTQASTAVETAFEDFANDQDWETFQNMGKLDQNSKLATTIIEAVDAVTEKALGIKVHLVELKFYEMVKSPANAEVEKSQVAKLIAENEGSALVKTAEKRREARLIDADADGAYFNSMGKVMKNNPQLAEFMKLEQVKDTELLSYGGGASSDVKVMATTSVDGKKTKPKRRTRK